MRCKGSGELRVFFVFGAISGFVHVLYSIVFLLLELFLISDVLLLVLVKMGLLIAGVMVWSAVGFDWKHDNYSFNASLGYSNISFIACVLIRNDFIFFELLLAIQANRNRYLIVYFHQKTLHDCSALIVVHLPVSYMIQQFSINILKFPTAIANLPYPVLFTAYNVRICTRVLQTSGRHSFQMCFASDFTTELNFQLTLAEFRHKQRLFSFEYLISNQL